jgi:HlyD family secretion protein
VKQIRKAPQTVQNVVTYIVVIAAENSAELLLPGMTANLEVVVARRENILKVPNTALRFHPTDQPFNESAVPTLTGEAAEPGTPGRVFVLDRGGQPKSVPLRIGLTDGRTTEVISGDLVEGQSVVIGSPPKANEASGTAALLKLKLW